jgi:hypothetical protein
MPKPIAKYQWKSTQVECDLGDHSLEIELYDGTYYWVIKSKGRLLADGKRAVLCNAKKDAERAYEALTK